MISKQVTSINIELMVDLEDNVIGKKNQSSRPTNATTSKSNHSLNVELTVKALNQSFNLGNDMAKVRETIKDNTPSLQPANSIDELEEIIVDENPSLQSINTMNKEKGDLHYRDMRRPRACRLMLTFQQ